MDRVLVGAVDLALMRQPLEQGSMVITRTGGTVRWPASTGWRRCSVFGLPDRRGRGEGGRDAYPGGATILSKLVGRHLNLNA